MDRLWASCRFVKANENPAPVGLFLSDNRLTFYQGRIRRA
jgi:hypothetical protein